MAWYRGLRKELQPAFKSLVAYAQSIDRSTRVSSAFRSNTEQRRLYRRFLAGQSQYPVAVPGTSLHERGQAIDLVSTPETLRRLGALWQRAGGTWGGESDPIHFEARGPMARKMVPMVVRSGNIKL